MNADRSGENIFDRVRQPVSAGNSQGAVAESERAANVFQTWPNKYTGGIQRGHLGEDETALWNKTAIRHGEQSGCFPSTHSRIVLRCASEATNTC